MLTKSCATPETWMFSVCQQWLQLSQQSFWSQKNLFLNHYQLLNSVSRVNILLFLTFQTLEEIEIFINLHIKCAIYQLIYNVMPPPPPVKKQTNNLLLTYLHTRRLSPHFVCRELGGRKRQAKDGEHMNERMHTQMRSTPRGCQALTMSDKYESDIDESVTCLSVPGSMTHCASLSLEDISCRLASSVLGDDRDKAAIRWPYIRSLY